MKTYKFEIIATIKKIVEVDSEDMQTAEEQANELFNPNNDGSEEFYGQESFLISVYHK
ncbi:hypothetical protein LCGC14_0277960 [marine sediment metagenome]|uniref:Uncharacterized protein n=1 Tax=marine sediment metagenome TaxID=412755 RepID=A0A0F9UDM0_9ZZZZ